MLLNNKPHLFLKDKKIFIIKFLGKNVKMQIFNTEYIYLQIIYYKKRLF